MKKTIMVIGSGRGIGNSVAKEFASHDFRVILVSRSIEHLEEYKAEFEAEGIETYVEAADVGDFDKMTAVFDNVKERFGLPDVLFYNVGITVHDPDLTVPVDANLLMERYKYDTAAAYHCIQQVVCEEFAKKNGAIILTCGGIAREFRTDYFALTLDKAAFRAMVYMLHDMLAEKGIFLGAVSPCKAIGSSPENMAPVVAKQYWKLYEEQNAAEIIYPAEE